MFSGQVRHILAVIIFTFIIIAPLAGISHGEEGTEAVETQRTGHIDRVDINEIVIDDSMYRLLPSTIYLDSNMKNASWDLFQPGDSVGFTVNKEGEIKSLWPVK